MTNEDRIRIEAAAKTAYRKCLSRQLTFNRYDLQDEKSKSFIDGAEAEHAHLSPIIDQQREAIRELVEGLGTLRHGLFDSEKAVNDFIDNLINKYKQQ